ncbi:aspartate aminotransferase family protein [Roseomonas marmotae]|uniref:Aspartate aminotransferase family protein n=1 Tax=Roseomonas marmotae TaxID=2768161 RepID=A0ABS3KA22_9PROT|nr:aspartate aminotransferase family protein [Roseomonas marmotae]MBO1073790.1 aspartate aminotransferase family protein [Roseomonas marmotae]QTI78580.1 aspartate aminotransferase family protein [Roseomonas marmotae]
MTRILHRSSRSAPPVAASAQGSWITEAGGRRLLDACGGAAVSCLGHGHPRVVEAIRRQAGQLDYVHSGAFSNAAAEELAEVLVGHEPGGLAGAYFVSSGSEAMEAALKLARQYFLERGQDQRQHFIARRQSYHGNTLGALAVGGNAQRRAPYAPLLAEAFSHVSPAYAYRGQQAGESEAAYAARLAAELEAEFQRLGPDTVAAFIAEPVVGATLGCAPAPAGYFRAVRDVCDRHGALLILDEVMCGMGRTGTLHAWEQEGIAPDIQTIAKGLGGGFQPIGGLLIASPILDAIRDGSGSFKHGHTYVAHPIACAAALEVQHVIREEGLLPRVQALGERLRQGLEARLGQHPHVGDIRGRGLFQAIELVANRDGKTCFDPGLQVNLLIRDAALAAGVLCYPGGGTADGLHGDHALLAPPYTATEEEIDIIVDAMGQAVDRVTSTLRREARA